MLFAKFNRAMTHVLALVLVSSLFFFSSAYSDDTVYEVKELTKEEKHFLKYLEQMTIGLNSLPQSKRQLVTYIEQQFYNAASKHISILLSATTSATLKATAKALSSGASNDDIIALMS